MPVTIAFENLALLGFFALIAIALIMRKSVKTKIRHLHIFRNLQGLLLEAKEDFERIFLRLIPFHKIKKPKERVEIMNTGQSINVKQIKGNKAYLIEPTEQEKKDGKKPQVLIDVRAGFLNSMRLSIGVEGSNETIKIIEDNPANEKASPLLRHLKATADALLQSIGKSVSSNLSDKLVYLGAGAGLAGTAIMLALVLAGRAGI